MQFWSKNFGHFRYCLVSQSRYLRTGVVTPAHLIRVLSVKTLTFRTPLDPPYFCAPPQFRQAMPNFKKTRFFWKSETWDFVNSRKSQKMCNFWPSKNPRIYIFALIGLRFYKFALFKCRMPCGNSGQNDVLLLFTPLEYYPKMPQGNVKLKSF